MVSQTNLFTKSVTRKERTNLDKWYEINRFVQVCKVNSESDALISPNRFTVVPFSFFNLLDYESCRI